MKKTLLTIVIVFASLAAYSQGTSSQARKILDNTALVVGNKNGAQADFSMTGKYGNTTGTILIKGNKFHAKTGQGIIWFDCKTQWSLNNQTDEVSVTIPNEAQHEAMNPYKFINIYKSGFLLSCKNVSGKHEVHMTAQNQSRAIKEMFILINKQYQPTQVRMRTDKGWTTIKLSNFKTKNLPDNTFRFNSADFPNAEIIDLR